ncbi:MAG: GspH/FimT family pseudopilin [Deltaproteobacteria bacterium]|nr:GspH/FimT family pseudopilin [Deltaproteobacteria bacterium]
MSKWPPQTFVSSDRGFTLVEIVVALALFSILAAIAIPQWGALLPTFRLNSAARQIQSELNRVKARAVSENTNFRLVFLAASYGIERDNGTGYETTGEGKPLPEGIDVRSTTTSTLGFTARGTATPGTGGTVKLCNIKEAGKNVVVSSTGRIRICKPGSCNGTC